MAPRAATCCFSCRSPHFCSPRHFMLAAKPQSPNPSSLREANGLLVPTTDPVITNISAMVASYDGNNSCALRLGRGLWSRNALSVTNGQVHARLSEPNEPSVPFRCIASGRLPTSPTSTEMAQETSLWAWLLAPSTHLAAEDQTEDADLEPSLSSCAPAQLGRGHRSGC